MEHRKIQFKVAFTWADFYSIERNRREQSRLDMACRWLSNRIPCHSTLKRLSEGLMNNTRCTFGNKTSSFTTNKSKNTRRIAAKRALALQLLIPNETAQKALLIALQGKSKHLGGELECPSEECFRLKGKHVWKARCGSSVEPSQSGQKWRTGNVPIDARHCPWENSKWKPLAGPCPVGHTASNSASSAISEVIYKKDHSSNGIRWQLDMQRVNN